MSFPAMNDAAQLCAVRKVFGRSLVLDGIDLHIGRGEIVGLLGPNGSGKTTILKLLAGMLRPDGGTVRRAARFRALIEEPRFYPSMTGADNLFYFASLSGGDRKAAERAAERLRLGKFIGRRVRKDSLGMRQKLGIACMLLADADLLILDEPMNGLDPFAVVEVRTLLRQLAEEHKTGILLSGHSLSEMQKICHRVVFLKEGRILSECAVGEGVDLEELYVSYFREEA